jgi:GMP synthase-like glutamine amidotransferase
LKIHASRRGWIARSLTTFCALMDHRDMSRAIILQHVDYAGPGRIVPVLRDFGIPTEVRHLYRGDEVPSDLDELRMLVVLGGPMSVKDIGGEQYPFLAREVETLKRVVTSNRATLGIALGAQLLAHAAGAKVYPNTKAAPPAPHGAPPAAPPTEPPALLPEYGWAPVTFPFPGGTEPIVQGMIDGMSFLHWHRDTFDLPRLPAPASPPPPPAPPPPTGNSLLASSKLCKNQAFRFRTRLFGFQFHFELTEPDIEKLIESDRESLISVLGADGPQRVRDDTRKNYARHARAGERILKNFVQYLRRY